jgi:hypothetical protein
VAAVVSVAANAIAGIMRRPRSTGVGYETFATRSTRRSSSQVDISVL